MAYAWLRGRVAAGVSDGFQIGVRRERDRRQGKVNLIGSTGSGDDAAWAEDSEHPIYKKPCESAPPPCSRFNTPPAPAPAEETDEDGDVWAPHMPHPRTPEEKEQLLNVISLLMYPPPSVSSRLESFSPVRSTSSSFFRPCLVPPFLHPWPVVAPQGVLGQEACGTRFV